MWFVYIIYSKKIDRYYVGYKDDLELRLERHNGGCGKYTLGVPWKLVEMIKQSHKKIEKYFNTGIGVKLQYRDSKIAEAILKYFTRKSIVCLCIHDSFIVPSQYQDELVEVMKREYKKGIGFDCELKVNG